MKAERTQIIIDFSNNVNVYCSADCDCSLILVPEYQKDTFYDDIVGINQKESYISAAEQFVKCCHPPVLPIIIKEHKLRCLYKKYSYLWPKQLHCSCFSSRHILTV